MLTNDPSVLFKGHTYIFIRPHANYKVTTPVVTLLTDEEYLTHKFPDLFRKITELDLPTLNEFFF